MKYIVHSDLDLEKVRLHLGSLSLEKPVEITIKEWKKNCTNAQRRLMHLWFNKIAEHRFLTAGEMHSPLAWKEYLKEKFLGFDMVEMPDGSVKAITKHTSKCSTKEITEFLEKVDYYAVTELELMLPRPDDIY